jgi:hypothetical protein
MRRTRQNEAMSLKRIRIEGGGSNYTPSLTEYRPTALSAAKEGCCPGLAMYGHCLAIQRQRHSEGLGLTTSPNSMATQVRSG